MAVEAAYSKGEEWYEAMHAYVESNIVYTKDYVEKNLPGVKMTDLEGTYLVWLDFRETGLSVDALEDLIIYKAGQRKDFWQSWRGLPENQCGVPKGYADGSVRED